MSNDLDTNQIKDWRSIVTLIVFVLTNIIVLFPFHIPLFIPRALRNGLLDVLGWSRVIPPRGPHSHNGNSKHFVRLSFPVNFVTAPLIADLFLLATLAIGRQEVHDGTVGANNIFPIDIMAFFITLAYIAISIDASGLIRYLAFKVLQKGGRKGYRLYLYLYSFFFALAGLVGNDPVILSGTAFLAYMTRVSSNIKDPRAWIYTQFAVANIGSAILVSSNPTNLVLAGAFNIKFINYTANMIVPVLATVIVLFPFLLYVIFYDSNLVPTSITLHELPEEMQTRKPINPNIPNADSARERVEGGGPNAASGDDEQDDMLSLEEIMNPFLDKGGAWFGGVIMAATLITILVLNAVTDGSGEHPVFWVTLPAAVVMFCWDLAFGWKHRAETRAIARKGRENALTRAKQMKEGEHDPEQAGAGELVQDAAGGYKGSVDQPDAVGSQREAMPTDRGTETHFPGLSLPERSDSSQEVDVKGPTHTAEKVEALRQEHDPATLVSIVSNGYRWLQETFPTVMAVLTHLPLALIPFALAMFVLVQALVTNGWVAVFAYGWHHWVNKTGTVGAIGGMGFLSVIMCNFAGTNIGTTILLCRVVQAWVEIHRNNGTPISERTFWATVYSMAIGVNYGAFSVAFSGSLAGMLWRDILARKQIYVKGTDFARYNLPIIAVSMVVGCAVLVGQIYIIRSPSPYAPA